MRSSKGRYSARSVFWINLLSLFFLAPRLYAQQEQGVLVGGKSRAAAKLRVGLDASKRLYKVGEIVSVVFRVENAGAGPVYVHPRLGIIDMADAGFRIDVFDARGRKLQHRRLEAFFAGHSDNFPIVEFVEKHWILLLPQHFYGRRAEMAPDLYGVLRKPGRYKLVDTYFNRTSMWLTEGQKDALKELDYPIWSGEIMSNPVWIEITK